MARNSPPAEENDHQTIRDLRKRIARKRFIFTLSTGRSGTGYLAALLGMVPGACSLHEPEPKFSHVMRHAQDDGRVAHRFWMLSKLPVIARDPASTYVETSHVFGKGFLEPLLEFGIVPDVIVLRRPAREVALSLYKLNTIPGRSDTGLQFLLSPCDRSVLHIPDWEKYDDYQLCYWYCLEMERHISIQTDILRAHGANIYETTLDEISTESGARDFIDRLGIASPSKTWLGDRSFDSIVRARVNAKSDTKRAVRAGKIKDPRPLESVVESDFAQAGSPPLQTRKIKSNGSGKAGICTILLSWNRPELLDRTITTYLATVEEPWDLIIVDNFSDAQTRNVIARHVARESRVTALYLTENLGGEALNLGMALSRGDLLHLSENDLEYRSGWSHHVRQKFAAFPALGQLSVFGPVPEDDEAWENHPSTLRHANGEIVYEALGNVGTSSIIRQQFVDEGLRVRNTNSNGFLFPDDGKLSNDIKSRGYLVAWSDRHLTRNVGHEYQEFVQHREYYAENYRSKPRLGEAGWRERMENWKARPKPERASHLFTGEPISTEKTNPSPECPEPYLWSMLDGWTAEIETLEFLYALVRLVKPGFVLETGTWRGYSAVALSKALIQNGRGRLVSLEHDRESCDIARRRMEQAGLAGIVEIVCQSSMDYPVPDEEIDLLLLDSALELRGAEFERFLPRLARSAVVIFHDTNRQHRVVRRSVARFRRRGILVDLQFSTPRGLTLCQLTPFGFKFARSAGGKRIGSRQAGTAYGIHAAITKLGARITDVLQAAARRLRPIADRTLRKRPR